MVHQTGSQVAQIIEETSLLNRVCNTSKNKSVKMNHTRRTLPNPETTDHQVTILNKIQQREEFLRVHHPRRELRVRDRAQRIRFQLKIKVRIEQ